MIQGIAHIPIGLVFCLSLSAAVAARDFSLGTYQSRLGGDETSNQWQIEFNSDGRYALHLNGNTLQPVEKGVFKVERGTISLDDGTGQPKSYRWNVERKQMRLSLIGEPRRVGDVHLTRGPWDKLGDPLPANPLDDIDTSPVPNDLVEWANHQNSDFRRIAATRLRDHGQAALPLLVMLLDDHFAAEEAALSLVSLGAVAKPAEVEIAAVASSASNWVALYATDALIAIDPKSDQIVPILKRLLNDDNWHVRVAAATRLRDSHPDQISLVVQTLVKLVSTDDSHGRSRVAGELAKCGEAIGPDGISALKKLLADSDEYVRGVAAEAAGQLGPAAKETVPELIKLLADNNSVVRTHAVVALGKIGPGAQDAVPELTRIMTERSYLDEGREARTALGKIAPGKLAAIERRPYLIAGGVGAAVVFIAGWFLFRRRHSPAIPVES